MNFSNGQKLLHDFLKSNRYEFSCKGKDIQKNAEAFFDMGKLQTKSKDYKKAIIAYQEAAKLN